MNPISRERLGNYSSQLGIKGKEFRQSVVEMLPWTTAHKFRNFDQRVTVAAIKWMALHPSPDSPLLFVGPNVYSPREIAEGMLEKNELGVKQLKAFRHFVESHPDMDSDRLINLLYRAAEIPLSQS